MGNASGLPMEGSLPPDLQGTLFRVGPARVIGGGTVTGGRESWTRPAAGSETAEAGAGGAGPARTDDGEGRATGGSAEPAVGALHAIELRDGMAVSYLHRESSADSGVFWHAGSVLALPEMGLPLRFSRYLEPQEFAGALSVPIASHVHRVASDGARVLFTLDDGGAHDGDEAATWLRIGEWDASGALRTAQAVELERATWQHDVAVTERHVVFIESPTRRLADPPGSRSAVPFGWEPGAETWVGVLRRGGGGSEVLWSRVDPCLVTHVLGAWDVSDGADNEYSVAEEHVVVYVCRYDAPEAGQPVDCTTPVVPRGGIGTSTIGRSLAALERWDIVGRHIERTELDERRVEYPRMDAVCDGSRFRYGYCVEMAPASPANRAASGASAVAGAVPGGVTHEGLLRFDLARDDVASWSPGAWLTASEPLFVRAIDGRSDDEGWLLTLVDDPNRGASDLYVLDASSLGRRRPEAVVHLPQRLPFGTHGEWVPAESYR